MFLHDNFNLIKDNAAAPSVMQCHAQEPVFEKTCATTEKNVKIMFFGF